jgi:hypothetical protein
MQTPSSHEKFFPKPNIFCPAYHSLCGTFRGHRTPIQLTAEEQNYQFHQPFVPSKEANESQKHVRSPELGKYAATQL